MKKLIVAMILAATAVASFAACPAGTRYQCWPTSTGKQQCGCW